VLSSTAIDALYCSCFGGGYSMREKRQICGLQERLFLLRSCDLSHAGDTGRQPLYRRGRTE